jgi:hypothetical protein
MRAVPVKSLYQNETVVLRPESAITTDRYRVGRTPLA